MNEDRRSLLVGLLLAPLAPVLAAAKKAFGGSDKTSRQCFGGIVLIPNSDEQGFGYTEHRVDEWEAVDGGFRGTNLMQPNYNLSFTMDVDTGEVTDYVE